MSKKTQNISIQSLAINFINDKSNKNFTLLIDRTRPGLHAFAYKFVKDNDIANDVVSQTYIAVWQKIHQYNNKYNFSTWMYAIAKNEALGILRHTKRNLSHTMLSANNSKMLHKHSPSFTIDTEYILPEDTDVIQYLYDASISAIDDLPEPYKTVMLEREVNQKQLSVIAEELGWHLSTVKTRLRKARKDISKILSKTYPEIVEMYLEK